ncbi:MAG: serine/threonine-protein kinase [Caulobacteraceae bacterium]
MDDAKAAMLAARLAGHELEGWTIEGLINHGKSAAVFRARRDGQLAAVKVFDEELIERYGDQTQLERINRELELKGHPHQHLVSIYGGGHDATENLHYVIMEYLDGQNLKECLQTIELSQVPTLLAQLASAAKCLEERGLVHRDIKPENIVIVEGGHRLVLLDFGVIRPVKGSDLTDPEGVQAFIGTLQYSSPEYLLREEEQNEQGYRALTFYQIGAVLHDLLVKRPIFEQFANPYGKLVNAVQHERPIIVNPDAPGRLVQLAERCLLKNPRTRVRVVHWEDFDSIDDTSGPSARDRVAERMVTLRAQREEASFVAHQRPAVASRIRNHVLSVLKLAATAARTSIPDLPPLQRSRCEADDLAVEFVFEPSAEQGFPHGLVVRVRAEVVDAEENVISCDGFAYISGHLPNDGAGERATWFEGVFDTVSLNAAFERFFFEAAEWCLKISPAVDDAFKDTFRPQARAGRVT